MNKRAIGLARSGRSSTSVVAAVLGRRPMKVPFGGGNPFKLASLEQDVWPRDIAVDATKVY